MWRCVVIVILFSLSTVSTRRNPKLKTISGPIEGTWIETERVEPVAGYLGIEYAKRPIGDLRFKKPERLRKEWRHTRPVQKYREPCKAFRGSVEGREDCLYLNVFKKHVNWNSTSQTYSDKLPVMVFLISDSYGNNDNAFYTPDYLLEHEVVLVTVNYRLGYFGFFTTGDEVAPGNYGLKDVLEALYWIRMNVAAFGGDPESVTLIGQGAGAGVVHLLALSPKSEGLFHKYVTQSGSALMPWSYRPREKARATSLAFAASVNCTGESKEIINCLQDLGESTIGDKGIEIVTPWSSYGPTDEPESEEAVITQHPKTLIERGKARDIPWLTGVVANEGSFIDFAKLHDENSTICEELKKRFQDVIFAIADYRDSIADGDAFAERLISFYFDGKITENCTSYFVELAEDMSIYWPIFDGVTRFAKEMESPMYFYNFAYAGTFTMAEDMCGIKRSEIGHGEDVNYLFPVLNYVFEDLQLKNTESDITVINIVGEMWTSFARTGVPKASLTPDWTSYREEQSYMEFGPDAHLSLKHHFLEEKMNFWINLSEDLFVEPKDPDETTGDEDGSAWSVTESYSISKSLLYFIAQFVILAIFNHF